ncbi:MAG: DMT family transporter [Gammaproteobacteria bacterium]
MKPQFGLGLAAALFATLTWGVQLPLAKDAFSAVDPFHITAARYLLAALCLAVVLVVREGWGALSYRGQGRIAAGLGIVGICGSPLLTFIGMSMSRAEHAVVIVTMQPMIAALVLWLLRGLRPAPVTALCILAAFTGVLLVVTKGSLLQLVESPRALAGDAIVLVGAVCWVAYTMGLGRLSGWSVWRVTVLTMLPGAIMTSLITATLVGFGVLTVPGPAAIASVGWELAYLTFIGVLAAMLAWNFGTSRIGALNATLFINCMPVVTFLYRALQGQRFAAIEVAGAALVVGALIANNLYLRARHRVRA